MQYNKQGELNVFYYKLTDDTIQVANVNTIFLAQTAFNSIAFKSL
jgi:hypothetical protein